MEQFGNRPTMVRQSCCNGWGALNPAIASLAHGEFETQAVVVITEVVKTPDHDQAGQQSLRLLGQVAGAPGEPGQTLAKGGIEPLDIGRVDHTSSLGEPQKALDHLAAALNHPALNGQPARLALLDHLDNGDVGPGDHPWAGLTTFP